MKYYAKDIMRLMQELAQKTEKRLVHTHFEMMHEMMLEKLGRLPFSSGDYLYRKVYLRVKGLTKNKTEVKFNQENIEAIVAFLGYNDYEQFLKMEYPERDSSLYACIGSWYSYVRCNSGARNVFISPVKIFVDGQEIKVKLKGPVLTFEGNAVSRGGCMFSTLKSEGGKEIHLVMKLGVAKMPKLLQGVFSAVSTAGDPIAGRELLIRQIDEYEELKNEMVRIDTLVRSVSEEQRAIGTYFSERKDCILKGGRSSAFTWSDIL